VDIVAYDKYEGSPSTWKTSAATTVFLTLVNDTKDTKMVAMSENDVIPDIKNITNEGAWWLYFCPWYGDFITSPTNNDPALLKTIYNSQSVVTLDELPANLYGMTHTIAIKSRAPLKPRKSPALLVVNKSASIRHSGANDIFSLTGKKIQLTTKQMPRNGIFIKNPR
jgi:hypothetical protein